MSNLEKLMYLAGVAADYVDYGGQYQVIPHDVRCRALVAMGYPIDDSGRIDKLVFDLDAKPWQSWVRPFNVLAEHAPLTLSFHPEELDREFAWTLTCEDGTVLTGIFVPSLSSECGDYYIGAERYSARALELPSLPIGYHHFDIRSDKTASSGELVICPEHCFETSTFREKRWGVTCQLYSLRSERNWGIGDFLDLAELIDHIAPRGADMIGLNPLHALCHGDADGVSPYSPSDRRYYNPLYIAPELVPDYSVRLLHDIPGVRTELQRLRELSHVDYDSVSRLKYKVYRALYDSFLAEPNNATQRRIAFDRFVENGGQALATFCNFEAQSNQYIAGEGQAEEFCAYLQWLCRTQLVHCQQHALGRGMAVGLIGDMAVGSVGQGNEVLANPEIYSTAATIGAPPDPFSSSGQDWGLPVMKPVAIRQNHYRHFIHLLRSNMENYGAIRMDHVMSLMRLWWCVPATDGSERAGAYVYYPYAELLALVKLESRRCKCQVIGEDLGVVAEDFRRRMQDSGVLGNNVFYFEQHYDHRFKSPEEQREQAVLMITNHDVPTLRDWWSGGDLQRRFELGAVLNQEELALLSRQRYIDKTSILQTLSDQTLLPEGWSVDDADRDFEFALCEAIHRFCARSASRWVLLQLEDLQMMTDPVNIPGTFREYPNWRRKQKNCTSEIFAFPEVNRLLELLQQERTLQNV